MKKYLTIKEIINQCENKIYEEVKSLKFIKCIDFIDIFPTSKEHKKLLDEEAKNNSTVIKKTEKGNFYIFNNPVETRFGDLKIYKIRIFDETRLNWQAAPDFATTNYEKFFEIYKKDKRFKYVEIPTYKGLEFKTKNSLIYFLDELTTDYFNIK